MKRAILISVALLLCLMGTAWGETVDECRVRYTKHIMGANYNSRVIYGGSVPQTWCAENPPTPKMVITPLRPLEVEIPPEREKPKPCRWEVKFVPIRIMSGIDTPHVPIEPGWEPWKPYGTYLIIRREVCE